MRRETNARINFSRSLKSAEQTIQMKKALIIILTIFLNGALTTYAGAQNTPELKSDARTGAVSAFAEVVVEAEATGVVALPADQWKPMPMKGLSGDAAFSSSSPGATLEYDFNGAGISADVVVGKSSGIISVAVDGNPLETIDLYRNRMAPGPMRMALANNLTLGTHKLRIEVLSDHNLKSLGSLVAVDTLRVASEPYGSISGVLECRYNEGLPVMRAKASATGKDGELDIITDVSGEFVFNALAPGTYTLRFEHPGFAVSEQTNLAITSGQTLILPKVLLEENIGARPLTDIRYPLGVRPVIVRPGDDFPVEVATPETASGWQVTLESPWATATLELKNASFSPDKGRWTLNVTTPSGIPSLLYGIRLKFTGGEDFQPRAVMVVSAFKDSIKVVHLTDVHVYRSEQLFDRYRQLADEINLINPDIIVVTGDMTDSNGYTGDRWPESDQYPPMLDLWNSFYMPTFIVPGNHDLSPSHNEDDYARWNRFFETTDFSFDVGLYHFTAFDDAFTMVSAMHEEAYRDDLFPEQLAWIENDLSRNSDAKMRILLYHVPLHSTKSKVNELAASYGVRLALYGHVHMNQVDKFPSTTYVQTAAAFEGNYRVVNLNNGKIGEINAKKDGYSAFSIGTLKTDVQTSPDGRSVTVKVTNISIRPFPGAAWRSDMPTAQDYTCDGCTVVARYADGGRTLVMFTFDISPKGETTAILSAK
jgi:predicted MPP superfamily phosphohydrolase